VIGFWESTEAFDRFAQERLMPAGGELGDRAFPAPPDRKEFPLRGRRNAGLQRPLKGGA
jgi:hypothetical protein